MSFLRDLKIAVRSLWRVRALWITVALTLALGIGANAAIFSVVRAVLLRPLANRDEDRLLYLRQSAPGIGDENAAFSVPEIDDLGKGLKTITELGTFSPIDFTIVGLGTPREIPAGVVDGHYFEVMGLRPVLGRLLTTIRRWAQCGGRDRADVSILERVAALGPERDRKDGAAGERPAGRASATIVGVLEPSVPYPVATEIIANVVTSPHHLSATMVTGREHRMTEVFARLAPGATLEAARSELSTRYAAIIGRTSGGLQARGPLQNRCDADARPDQFARQHGFVGAVCGLGTAVCDCVLECGQPGAGANGSPRIGAGGALGAGSWHGGAAAFAAGGKPGAVRKRSAGGADAGVADGGGAGAVCSALLGARRRAEARLQPGVVWDCAGADGGGVPGADSAAALGKRAAGRRHSRVAERG